MTGHFEMVEHTKHQKNIPCILHFFFGAWTVWLFIPFVATAQTVQWQFETDQVFSVSETQQGSISNRIEAENLTAPPKTQIEESPSLIEPQPIVNEVFFATATKAAITDDSNFDWDTVLSESGERASIMNILVTLPEIIEAKDQLNISEAELQALIASSRPKGKFFTDAKYPITKNISETNNRLSNVNNRYLDGRFVVEVEIYDFGLLDDQKQAETYRKASKRLELEEKLEQAMFELLSHGGNHIGVVKLLEKIDLDLDYLQIQLDQANDRYLQGVGTKIDIREIEILILSLERDKAQATFEKLNYEQEFEIKYKTRIQEYLVAIDFTVSNLPNPIARSTFGDLPGVRKFDYLVSAKEADLRALKKSKYPKITSSASLNLYDIHSQVAKDYSVDAGLGFSMPLFDGGLNESKKAKLLSETNQQKNLKAQRLNDIERSWEKNVTELQKAENDISQMGAKLKKLIENERQLRSRFEALEPNYLELVRVNFQIRSVDRERLRRDIDLVRLGLENVFLRGGLLRKEI
jgi:hypothetical protein